MLRPRRRRVAAINSEIRDGIVPAADGLVQATGKPSATGRGYRTVALIIACALFMEQMDATVLATALPAMARDFGVPAPSLSSALTAYLLALAIFIPASGRIADRLGSKIVFQAAIVLFLAGSMLCGQAHSLGFLIFSRFLQGIGGAMMIPVGRLVLLRSVAKEDMVQAMSWLIMPALIGPIVGPPLGGAIVTFVSWRWIFYLNLPIGLLGLALVARFIGQVKGERPAGSDLTGFVLSGICLGCLLFGFEMASRVGELARAGVLIAVGLVAGAFYLRHARRQPAPILDLTLMRVPTFRLSVIGGSLTRITQGAQPFLLPLMFQLTFGMTAAASGALTIAGAIGSLGMKFIAPGLLRRFGFRATLVAGGIAASLGYATCALFRPDWTTPQLFAVLAISGFFMSFQFTAYNTIAYDEIPPERMSSATSFYATFQQLMLSLGICVGALALRIGTAAAHRGAPGLAQFQVAFVVVTVVSLTATIWNARFSATAGDELAGRAMKA